MEETPLPPDRDADRLVAELGRLWNEREPASLARLYEPGATLVYAGKLVAQGAEIERWLYETIRQRRSIALQLRLRAFTEPVMCTEYVSRVETGQGNRRLIAGAEVFTLGSTLTDIGVRMIHRQHIYPAEVDADSPVVAALEESG
jgi:hypothetical protein